MAIVAPTRRDIMTPISHPLAPKPVPRNLICLGLALILILFAPSGDSFWIDEANSANMALQPGLCSWWQAVAQIASDLQMAPYFLQLWVWEKLAGGSEWSLRLNNLPWVFLGIGAWFLALPRSLGGIFALIAGMSPFLWYYANEIRPYAMLFGASSLMFASLFRLTQGISKPRLLGFGTGALLAMGASSAALPWVGIASLLALLALWHYGPDRSYLGLGLLLAVPAAGLTGLYLWSFSLGNRPNSPEPSNLASLLFVPYELLGFTGLGPGRMELRAGGVGSIKHYLPLLGLLFGCLLPVGWAAVSTAIQRIGPSRSLAITAACIVPVVAVAALGWMTGLRTTGRHFTPALGLLLPLLSLGARRLWNGKPWGRLVVICLFLCLGISSLQIRTAGRHKKDNYREAARIARKALESGRTVWWAADPCGAIYYKLPVGEVAGPGRARLIHNLEAPAEGPPEVVVLSRPDVYDSHQIVSKMLANFRLTQSIQSFTIWEKPAKP